MSVNGDFLNQRALVLDNGTGISKNGYAGEDQPRSVFPTCLGYPRYENIIISDTDVVICEGNFSRGPGTAFHFNRDGIYFHVQISNFPREEAIKIIESML